jgi:hypothetical protein
MSDTAELLPVEEKAKPVEEKKKPGAKDVTLVSMVIAGIWIGVLSLLKAFWVLFFGAEKTFGLSMEEILLSGVVMAAIFSPIYLSIILDKIKDIRLGSKE